MRAVPRLVMLAVALASAPAAQAESGVARIWKRAAALALMPVPPLAALQARCGEDALCAGRVIAQALGPRARIVRRRPPDTDAIRLVKVKPTITAMRRLRGGGLSVELRRFGIQALPELRAALKDESLSHLVVDLRRNTGGDVVRMLRVAAIIIGARRRAVRLRTARGERWLDVPKPGWRVKARQVTVLVGPQTASSAELLAALLRRHAGARLLGARTFGKNWLTSAVPLAQGRALLVPSAMVSVPGERIRGGLRPDAPIPPGLVK